MSSPIRYSAKAQRKQERAALAAKCGAQDTGTGDCGKLFALAFVFVFVLSYIIFS